MRLKPYIAWVVDADGTTYEYLFEATSRRRAERDVREWVERTEWAASIVGIERAIDDRRGAKGRRLLRVGGVTFGVSGTIITIMIVGLSLEGAL